MIRYIWIILLFTACHQTATYINREEEKAEGEKLVKQFYDHIRTHNYKATFPMFADSVWQKLTKRDLIGLYHGMDSAYGPLQSWSLEKYETRKETGERDYTFYALQFRTRYEKTELSESFSMEKVGDGEVRIRFYGMQQPPSPEIALYEEKMTTMLSMDRMALEVYHMPESTPAAARLSEIRDKGIYYWKENLNLCDALDTMDLPPVLKERTALYRKYFTARLKSYELMYKKIGEHTGKYNAALMKYEQEVEALKDEIKRSRSQQ